MRVYSILKSVKGNSNAASRFMTKMIDRYILKKKNEEMEQEGA